MTHVVVFHASGRDQPIRIVFPLCSDCGQRALRFPEAWSDDTNSELASDCSYLANASGSEPNHPREGTQNNFLEGNTLVAAQNKERTRQL